jgi:hypothetical protein
VYFRYELSAITVKFVQKRKSFAHFLVQVGRLAALSCCFVLAWLFVLVHDCRALPLYAPRVLSLLLPPAPTSLAAAHVVNRCWPIRSNQ